MCADVEAQRDQAREDALLRVRLTRCVRLCRWYRWRRGGRRSCCCEREKAHLFDNENGRGRTRRSYTPLLVVSRSTDTQLTKARNRDVLCGTKEGGRQLSRMTCAAPFA